MRAVLGRLRAHPWVFAPAAVIVLVGASSGVYLGTRDSPASASTAASRTMTVSTGTVKQTVTATGTLAPADQEQLNFQVSGQVTAVDVSTGDTVKKGQTLATIDAAGLAANKAQAKAAVASARAKVDDDNSNGATSTQLAADKAALTATKKQLSSAKSQMADATLSSPIRGVVASVNLTVGQSVSGSAPSSSGSGSGGTDASGGSTSTPGGTLAGGAAADGSSTSSAASPQILVISTNSWIVNATVDANSVGLIKKDDQAQLTVTGASSTVYGTVSSIGLVSSSTAGTASYPVTIDVTGSPRGMHDGADVTASVIYKQVTGLVVPTIALHRNANGGEYVEQVRNGKSVRTPVQVGVSAGGQTQITSGLSSGDQVKVPQPRISRSGPTTGGQPGGGFPGGGFPGGGFPGGGFAGGGFGGGGGAGG